MTTHARSRCALAGGGLLLLFGMVVVMLAGCDGQNKPPPATNSDAVGYAIDTPCKSGEDPTEVVPLNQQYTADQWQSLSHKQKATLISSQGLKHQTYGQDLKGQTKGCR